VAYFDESHYINVNNERQLVINDYTTPDGGNSFVIRPAKTFNAKAALEKFPIVEVAELTLNYSTATLMAGEALALQASIAPSYATDQTVTWTTSDNTVAIVARGVVTAVAPGEAVITAKAGDKEATCVITVEKRYVAVMGILLSQTTATITEGDELTLTATVLPEDADDKAVTWETSDAGIATVEDGVVKVSVGSVEHPMAEEHSILWVELKTDKGVQRKNLVVGEPPVVSFALLDEKPLEVLAYCNLHGLWKSEI
jgi:desulfoferrodoxin